MRIATILQQIATHLDPSARVKLGSHYLVVCPRIGCTDGFNLSVQASESAYCLPRNNDGRWYKVEVGFPNRVEPLLLPYAEDYTDPTNTVYGYVPVELVALVIQRHGGIANTPELDDGQKT